MKAKEFAKNEGCFPPEHVFGLMERYAKSIIESISKEETKLTDEILQKNGFDDLVYGWEKTFNDTHTIRLTISDGWYYPQIEEAAEMSGFDDQIVALNRISTLEELNMIVQVVTGNKLEIVK